MPAIKHVNAIIAGPYFIVNKNILCFVENFISDIR